MGRRPQAVGASFVDRAQHVSFFGFGAATSNLARADATTVATSTVALANFQEITGASSNLPSTAGTTAEISDYYRVWPLDPAGHKTTGFVADKVTLYQALPKTYNVSDIDGADTVRLIVTDDPLLVGFFAMAGKPSSLAGTAAGTFKVLNGPDALLALGDAVAAQVMLVNQGAPPGVPQLPAMAKVPTHWNALVASGAVALGLWWAATKL